MPPKPPSPQNSYKQKQPTPPQAGRQLREFLRRSQGNGMSPTTWTCEEDDEGARNCGDAHSFLQTKLNLSKPLPLWFGEWDALAFFVLSPCAHWLLFVQVPMKFPEVVEAVEVGGTS
jgi:hypothetical protein